jgi:hypothetical protein
MARINDWLDDRVQDIIHAPGLHTRKGDFRDLAKTLVEQAEAEGFTIAEPSRHAAETWSAIPALGR